MSNDLIDQLKQHIGEQGADINKLERQLFIAERTVTEQKETIKNAFAALQIITVQNTEQSALIEKLAEALQNVEGALLVPHNGSVYHSLSINEYGRCIEALAAYNTWKGK